MMIKMTGIISCWGSEHDEADEVATLRSFHSLDWYGGDFISMLCTMNSFRAVDLSEVE
jgi:hypothetical protein